MTKSVSSCIALIIFINLIFAINPAGISDTARFLIFDTFQTINQNDRPINDEIVIIDIDEQALDNLGQWPWSRADIARIVRETSDSGAHAILLDFIFSEPDRTSPSNVLRSWSMFTDTSQIYNQVNMIPDPDTLLSEAILKAGNVVTSFTAISDINTKKPSKKSGFVFIGDNPKTNLRNYLGTVLTLPEIEDKASGNGVVTLDQMVDGVVRRIPLFIRINDELYPSSISETIRTFLNTSSYQIKSNTTAAIGSIGKINSFEAVRIENLNIPLTRTGEIWLRSPKLSSLKTYSAFDLITKKISEKQLKGKIVIFGTSAEGLAQTRATPTNENISGTQIYASAISQILNRDFLIRSDWFRGAELLMAIIASFLFLFVISKSHPVIGAFFSLASILLAGFTANFLFLHFKLLVDAVPLIVSLLTTYILFVTTQFSSNYVQRRQIRSSFERYLSPTVIEQLSRNPDKLKLGGEVKELTVLFCDIRKFTSISEQFSDDPKGLVSLLNRFLTPLTAAILEHEGTVDKYMGDCIMAFWNAPLNVSNHEDNACSAAQEMHKRIATLNNELKSEGRIPLEAGIGINSGIGLVGNVGSNQRFDYSVIGDTVNLAARLEGQSKTYGVPTLISEGIAKNTNPKNFIELDKIRVKGKRNPISIYGFRNDLTNPGKQSLENIEIIKRFLKEYRLQNWEKAEELIQQIKNSNTRLNIYSNEFLERIKFYQKQKKIENWDGVYDAKSK